MLGLPTRIWMKLREREIYILYIMYMYVYIYGPHILYYINKLHDHLNKHTNELQGGSIAASKKKRHHHQTRRVLKHMNT